MNKINRINLAVDYIVLHLDEYKNDFESLKQTMQNYLDEAWKLVEDYEATEGDALRIRDLARTVNGIIEIIG